MQSMLWMALLLPTQQVFSQERAYGSKTWAVRTVTEANNWNSVTYDKGLYIAYDDGSHRVVDAPSGLNPAIYTVSNDYNNVTAGTSNNSRTPTRTQPTMAVTNGPVCNTFTNKNTANGLGVNNMRGVFVAGSTIYAATNGGGLGISTDGGSTFTNKTEADGLGSNMVESVYVVGSTVYAATFNGLSISTDGGNTFINKTEDDGLGSNVVSDVFVVGSTVYAATFGGLSISTDGGNTFTNTTTANGLGNDLVYEVYVVGTTIYAATSGGLSISTNGGISFVNKTTANGLSDRNVRGVYAEGSTVYAATSSNGFSISTDGGNSFTIKTTADGLGNNRTNKVYAVGTTVYVATHGGLSISTDGGNSFTNNNTDNGLGNNFTNGVFAAGSTVYAATTGGLSFCACTPVIPSVSIFSNDSDNSINAGTSVTFTATPTNGGTTPTYVWKKNDSVIPNEAGATYTTNTLANGDKIKVEMTSNAACASPTTATSNELTMTVCGPLRASIIATTIVCTGNAIGLTASPNESGLTYAWSGPGNFSSTLRTPSRPNATLAMSGVYRLTVASPACGFSSTASVSVIATTPNGKAAPRLRALLINGTVAGLGNVYSVCSGAPVTATIAAISGTSYSWNGPNGSSGLGSLAVTAPPATISAAANANTAGNYTMTIFNGCDRSTTVNFSIRLSNCTSTRLAAAEGDGSMGLSLEVAPNPVRDYLTTNISGIQGDELRLNLIDAQGRSRQQATIEAAEGKAQHRFDVRSLPAGMYLLQAETATQRATKKVIRID